MDTRISMDGQGTYIIPAKRVSIQTQVNKKKNHATIIAENSSAEKTQKH